MAGSFRQSLATSVFGREIDGYELTEYYKQAYLLSVDITGMIEIQYISAQEHSLKLAV